MFDDHPAPMIRYLLLGIFFGTLALPAMAQEEETFDYQSELVWGIGKNTNSRLLGSVEVRYAKRVREDIYQTFGLEIANVKHPQEFKQSFTNGTGFIFGKNNYLFPVRGQYGRDWIVFRKAPNQGVQINLGVAAGPTLGLQAPYYIKYLESGSREVIQQYDPSIHTLVENIEGAEGPLRGISEASLVPGANIQAALTFEFGSFNNRVSALEAGVMFEAYSRPIEMMPRARSIQYFPSAFIGLYYGFRN